jgi:hypothetical protein
LIIEDMLCKILEANNIAIKDWSCQHITII